MVGAVRRWKYVGERQPVKVSTGHASTNQGIERIRSLWLSRTVYAAWLVLCDSLHRPPNENT